MQKIPTSPPKRVALDPAKPTTAREMAVGALVGMLLVAGCAPSLRVPAPGAARSAPTAMPHEPSTPPEPAARTADEILQARLQDAAAQVKETRQARGPQGEDGTIRVSARLAPEEIQRIVRKSFGRFRACYEEGLGRSKNLRGKVTVRFVIALDGSVSHAEATADLPDQAAVACIEKAFTNLSFPSPERGAVTVVYPIQFSPGDEEESTPAKPSAPSAPAPSVSVVGTVANAPAAPTPPDNPPVPAATFAQGDWPIVVVDSAAIRAAGVSVGSVQGLLSLGQLRKVDVLYDVLKGHKDAWTLAHPNEAFPGVAGLRVDPGVPIQVFKSVFQTIAFAGYLTILVQLSSDPAGIVELTGQVPAPPSSDALTMPVVPAARLALVLDADGATLVWKQGVTNLSEDRMAGSALDFAQRACDIWKLHGRHHDPADPVRDALIVQAGGDLSTDEVVMVARAIGGCTRERRDPGGPVTRVPALWITFSVR